VTIIDVGAPLEPTPTPQPVQHSVQTVPTFTAEDLEKVRKEEKDKLYPRLQTMEEELKALRADREAREKAEADALKASEEAVKKAAEEEMGFKELLLNKEKEFNAKIEQMEQDRQKDAALLERERQFSALQSYKSQRMEEKADEIMPELRDLVSGNTQEEIDASIDTMIARTSAIFNNIQSAQSQQRSQMRGPNVTAPPAGPMDNDPTYQTLTPEDIKNMSMSDWAKNRDRILGAASRNNSNRGLFG